jgi:V/A-type H+-transporting ATPase subunit C
VSDFDYGNARLRAMKARLLSRPATEALADTGSIQGLITAVANTAYRQAVEASLVHLNDMACLTEALRSDLLSTVGRARTFFSGPAGELAEVVFRRFDLHNVKTLLRGLERGVPANEILASTMPIGELRHADLKELAATPDVRSAIDLMATWRVFLARPLLKLRATMPGAELFVMEAALDRWHFRAAMATASQTDSVLGEALAREADAANIMTALSLVGVASATAILREQFGADGPAPLFVGPGHLPFELLTEAIRQESVPKAIETFAGTPYAATLADALDAYAVAPRLSVLERALAQRQLRYASGEMAVDPLGIGVLLGYVVLKTNEIANIRAVAQGLLFAERPERIRAELMFAE